MARLKRIGKILLDALELYIPCVLFLVFFILFVVQIISRYVFNMGLNWSEEVCSYSYVWMVFLATSYAERTDGNIYFSMLHDALPSGGKRVMDALHQVILIAFYVYMIPSTYDLFAFFSRRYSVVLRVPLSICYGGYLLFVAISVGRAVVRLVRSFTGPKAEAENENEEGAATL